jgi:long-chain fatty acid transport protein
MKRNKISLAVFLLVAAHQAYATDGYFAHGYGVKSQSMGGVGIALPQDALAAAANPAGMALIGDRVDFGLTWFRPSRQSEIVGNGGGANGSYSGNDTQNFLIPEFGYNRVISPTVTLGVSLYGNGGMNTDYKNGIPLFNGGTQARTGIDLIQVFVAPTISYKINESNFVGASINLAYQRFEAEGLSSFGISNNGHDSSYGGGLHLGWLGKINDTLSLGATYQSKTYMSSFDKYKGLFAEQGSFDIPETFGLGLAIKATPELTLAADVQRINYSDVKSVGNSIANFFTNGLGTDNGAGFGWRDVTAYKLGASYVINPTITLRGGYNHSTQPIPSSETLFNILAPGVVQDHLTLGTTWTLPNQAELTVSYVHAFENSVDGSNSINAAFGGGNANLKMYQDSLGVAYGWKL